MQRRTLRGVLSLAAVAVLPLAFAGVKLNGYAKEHYRSEPRSAGCFIGARRELAKIVPASGEELHQTADGSDAYLRLEEDRAVRCAYMLDVDLSRKVTTVLAHLEIEKRAQTAASLFLDVPPDAPHDAEAAATYLIAMGTLEGLPPDDAVVRARLAVEARYGCRFQIPGRTCKTRPPIPKLAIAAAVPGVAGVLPALGLGLFSGLKALNRAIDGLQKRWDDWRARKKKTKTKT